MALPRHRRAAVAVIAAGMLALTACGSNSPQGPTGDPTGQGQVGDAPSGTATASADGTPAATTTTLRRRRWRWKPGSDLPEQRQGLRPGDPQGDRQQQRPTHRRPVQPQHRPVRPATELQDQERAVDPHPLPVRHASSTATTTTRLATPRRSGSRLPSSATRERVARSPSRAARSRPAPGPTSADFGSAWEAGDYAKMVSLSSTSIANHFNTLPKFSSVNAGTSYAGPAPCPAPQRREDMCRAGPGRRDRNPADPLPSGRHCQDRCRQAERHRRVSVGRSASTADRCATDVAGAQRLDLRSGNPHSQESRMAAAHPRRLITGVLAAGLVLLDDRGLRQHRRSGRRPPRRRPRSAAPATTAAAAPDLGRAHRVGGASPARPGSTPRRYCSRGGRTSRPASPSWSPRPC